MTPRGAARAIRGAFACHVATPCGSRRSHSRSSEASFDYSANFVRHRADATVQWYVSHRAAFVPCADAANREAEVRSARRIRPRTPGRSPAGRRLRWPIKDTHPLWRRPSTAGGRGNGSPHRRVESPASISRLVGFVSEPRRLASDDRWHGYGMARNFACVCAGQRRCSTSITTSDARTSSDRRCRSSVAQLRSRTRGCPEDSGGTLATTPDFGVGGSSSP